MVGFGFHGMDRKWSWVISGAGIFSGFYGD